MDDLRTWGDLGRFGAALMKNEESGVAESGAAGIRLLANDARSSGHVGRGGVTNLHLGDCYSQEGMYLKSGSGVIRPRASFLELFSLTSRRACFFFFLMFIPPGPTSAPSPAWSFWLDLVL